MKFVKKIVILLGRGRGVLTLEKTVGGVNARFSSDVKTKGATFGVITRDKVYVRDYSGGSINISLECDDLSYIHAALVESGKILLYGTCAREKMWEANVLQLIWRNDALPAALANFKNEGTLVREEQWYDGLQLYNDRVESFLDGERVTAINERLAPTIDYSTRPELTESENDMLLAQKVEEALTIAHGVIVPRLNVNTSGGDKRSDELCEVAASYSPEDEGEKVELETKSERVEGEEPRVSACDVVEKESYATDASGDCREELSSETTEVTSDDGSPEEVRQETRETEAPQAGGGAAHGENSLQQLAERETSGTPVLQEEPPSAEIDINRLSSRRKDLNNTALVEIYERSSALNGGEEFDMSAILKYDEDGVAQPVEESGSGEPPYRTDAAFLAEYFEAAEIMPPVVPVYPLIKVSEPPHIRKATPLELHKDDVEKLFESAPRFTALEKLLPETVWVSVDMDGGTLAVGVMGGKLCYAVEGTYSPEAPPNLIDPKFVPAEPTRPNGKGYWLMTDKA